MEKMSDGPGKEGAPRRCPVCGTTSGGASVCAGCGILLVDERVGATLEGKYRIESLLGQGAVGRVYRGVRLTDRLPVAIKFLLHEWVHDAEQRARFRQEAEVLRRLRHPAVVELLEVGEEQVPYLVMELLRGRMLSEVMRRELLLLTPLRVIRIVDQIAAAMEAAHEAGVVHRDLKPGNVFLVAGEGLGEGVKVLDFGIALPAAPRDSRQRITGRGQVRGTPSYMSPEQCLGPEVGPPADIYAAAVILYELLAGDVPFIGSPNEVMLQQIRKAPPPIEELNPRRPPPPRLAALTLRALAKQPEQRPTARQFREELACALADLQAAAPEAAGQAETRCRRSHASMGQDAGVARGERRPEDLSGSLRVSGALDETESGAERPATDAGATPESESTAGLFQRLWRQFRGE
jgi:serine/threonine protein kinase